MASEVLVNAKDLWKEGQSLQHENPDSCRMVASQMRGSAMISSRGIAMVLAEQ